MFVMKSLDFRGHRIAYVDEGSGDPVLFLHNGGTSHVIWLPIMERLKTGHRLIAIDLLGYGDSARPGHGYTMDTYVALVEHVIQTLELEQPALVGNCMGSAISLHFALCFPEAARALILLNPLTHATLNAGSLGAFMRLHRKLPGIAGPVYNAASKFRLPRWSAGATLAMQLGKSGRNQKLHHHEPLVACHSSDGQLRSIIGVLEDIEAYEMLDGFQKPVNFPPMMVVWGEQNQILSASVGETLNQVLQPERLENIANTGHLAMLEEPAQISALITSFLHEQLSMKS